LWFNATSAEPDNDISTGLNHPDAGLLLPTLEKMVLKG
jgi:hypothetical protein